MSHDRETREWFFTWQPKSILKISLPKGLVYLKVFLNGSKLEKQDCFGQLSIFKSKDEILFFYSLWSWSRMVIDYDSLSVINFLHCFGV